MKNATGLEIECFVHGALLLLLFRSVLNEQYDWRAKWKPRGMCAAMQTSINRVENRKSADLMSLKDLCTIDMIPELVEAGIDSFKIEGRMKQPVMYIRWRRYIGNIQTFICKKGKRVPCHKGGQRKAGKLLPPKRVL